MHDFSSIQRAGRGPTAQILIWGGALLLLVGGLLAYPYVDSRLADVPTPSLTPSQIPSTVVRATSATAIAPTRTPAPTPAGAAAHTPLPTFTPTPALPSRIAISAINLDAPIVPVSWYTVEVSGQLRAMWNLPETRAAGWHETSAPLGVVGNTVLNGHNTGKGEVFRDLYKLDVGEEIAVYAGSISYTYTISEVLILPEAGQPLTVRIENAQYILPTEDERLTLVTCHPYGSLRNRLIVIAYPLRAVVATPDWRSIINR